MSRKTSHAPKTKEEKQRYIKLVDQSQTDPTIDEQTTEIDSSNAVGKESPELLTDEVRKPPFVDRFKEHIQKHWLEWLFALISLILLYFVRESVINDIDHGNSIEFQGKQIEEIKIDYKERIVDTKTDIRDDINDQQKELYLLSQVVEKINISITDLRLLTNELLIKLKFIEDQIDH